jgi:excisionase family DNA binding protein
MKVRVPITNLDGTFRLIDILSTCETAEILGISRTHVTRLCKSGVLTYRRVGKNYAITRESVERARNYRQSRGRGFLIRPNPDESPPLANWRSRLMDLLEGKSR